MSPNPDWLPKAAERFSFLRRTSGHSVRSLSNASGVSRQTIADFEAAQRIPTVVTMHKLGAALGVENLPVRLLEE